ncbi:tRNA (guanine-N(7)-)-methyltransferase non-catalytic subunit wdr4 [Adelges cooleyi]|uniref:tRNA (guanine-N(7)-)-methyltransferase non-catalytic subunit wdr4 n=1 Tax=Adelges cooleyi TaxID=133065 RepID=UPI00217FC70F|nr:tRNA (guanine-N(7)-)-methyltransferase non-catalytic subunit wdr4 [Adelges cooleyi]
MTSCMAVSENSIVVSSIDGDKCYVYSLTSSEVKNLTEHLGEAYNHLQSNNRDLQKACAAFSSHEKLFAYNPNKGKLLSIWNATSWSLVENKTLAKHATKIVFTPKTHVIVVGDKKGDVYAFEEQPVRLLGHSSMVLDICFSADEKYIITCDSDEKVRVSHYPNGKNILYYMMGHEAYVSGLCSLNNFILSGSGDGSLRLWDLKNGDLLDKLSLEMPVRSVVSVGNTAAVQFYNSKDVHIIKTDKKESSISIKSVKVLDFDSPVLDIASYCNQLWIISGNSVHHYSVDSNNEIVTVTENTRLKNAVEAIENLVTSFMRLENTDLMNFLYKKMVDKQKRAEQCLHNVAPLLHLAKRIKQA